MPERHGRAQLAFTRALATSVAEGIYAVDTEGRFTFVNPAAQQMLGWSEAELLGRPAHETIHYRHADASFPAEVCPLLAVLVSAAELRGHEDVFLDREGNPFPVLCSCAPILTEDVVTGAVVAFTDITEQKRTQEELLAAYQRERRIAETLQRSLLMRPGPDAFPRLAVETLYEAASDEARIGGDFYDAFALSGERVALVVGDICGQGLSAAAGSAEVKYALRAFLYADPAPERALTQLNAYLAHTWSGDRRGHPAFVALSAVVLETRTGRGRLAVAGIEPPLVLRTGGDVDVATTGGLPLGVASEARYEAEPLTLMPGDTLIQMSDGITEARVRIEGHSRLLGYEGVVRLARGARRTCSLRALGQTILEGARSFAQGSLGDDVCLLLARWQ